MFLLGLSPPACRAANRPGGKNKPRAVILPVWNDATTGQYVTTFRHRTPLVPVTAVLDLANPTVWVDCEKKGYVSSTYRGVHGALWVEAVPPHGQRRLYWLVRRHAESVQPEQHLRGLPENLVTTVKVDGPAVLLLAVNKRSSAFATVPKTSVSYTVLESGDLRLSGSHRRVRGLHGRDPPRTSRGAIQAVLRHGSKVGRTRVGPAVPTIELVLQNKGTSWVVFGANSMVAAMGGALCLGVVDVGRDRRAHVGEQPAGV
jgi:hypothetical protein